MSFLQTIFDIKNDAGLAFVEAFKAMDKQFSEQDLASAWLSVLQGNNEFYPSGWYAPPPDGVISLFGKPEGQFQRICNSSFRPEHTWPKPDIFYQDQDMVALYASPVHRKTHFIGDFGLTLYKGTNAELMEHCEMVLKSTLHIADYARPGMAFSELYDFAMSHLASQGFVNDIESINDATDTTNIGHTIPLSYKDDPTHRAIANAGSFEDIKDALRTGRIFVNSKETQMIEPDMAFTIEPRPSTDTLPQTWFHLTVLFDQGEKTICHGFHPVFEALNLQNLIKLLPD